MKFSFLLILSMSWIGMFSQVNNSPSTFDPTEFDAYVQQAVKDWEVPGMAVVVVKGDSVVFQKGYGVREIGKSEPVDKNTLFSIASTSKAFAAAAIGMLVDEGKLKWNDPVVKHLPDFRLKNADLSRQITIRDLLTHRAGLPNTDFLWFDPEESTGDIMKRLQYVDTAYPIRDGFTYQNIMYMVSGEVVETVSGLPWDKFLKTRILDPLKMTRTRAFRTEAEKLPNLARPHEPAGKNLIATEGSYADAIGPAGSMWSSVADMSQWIKFLLNDCRTSDGNSLLKKGTCDELFKPQTVISTSYFPTSQLAQPNFSTYGLGWFQQDFEGQKVDFHTGSLSGMVAMAAMIRDEKIGYYFLANKRTELRHALMYRVFDLFDNDPARDWSKDIKAVYDERDVKQKASQKSEDSLKTATRKMKTKHSLPLEEYSGTYEDELYGKIRVWQTGKDLRFQYARTKGKLNHWHYDTFEVVDDRLHIDSRPLVNFDLDSSGKVFQLRIYGRELKRVGDGE